MTAAMKAVVVFESMFGNTEQIAREIAGGLAAGGARVALADVRHTRPEDLRGCDLLVVGAPTHALSLSRAGTRQEAVRLGAPRSRAVLGVREWLPTLDGAFGGAPARPAVAVFDSRLRKVEHWPGSAARRAARILRSQDLEVLEPVSSFYVDDLRGPLARGERERARGWGLHLAEQAAARARTAAS